jgi:hypothetical protein
MVLEKLKKGVSWWSPQVPPPRAGCPDRAERGLANGDLSKISHKLNDLNESSQRLERLFCFTRVRGTMAE